MLNTFLAQRELIEREKEMPSGLRIGDLPFFRSDTDDTMASMRRDSILTSTRAPDSSEEVSPRSNGSLSILDVPLRTEYAHDFQNAEEPVNCKTTVMIKGIPCKYSLAEVQKEISALNLPFDFLYLPCNVPKRNRGYAFVNFLVNADAVSFITLFKEHKWVLQQNSLKTAQPVFSNLQGFRMNVRCYDNKSTRASLGPFVDYAAHAQRDERKRFLTGRSSDCSSGRINLDSKDLVDMAPYENLLDLFCPEKLFAKDLYDDLDSDLEEDYYYPFSSQSFI
jgi:hypothetical protein